MKTSRPPTTSTNYNSNSNRTLANLMNNKRPGLTITRGPRSTPSPPRGPSRPAKVSRPNPLPSGSNVLASGEVVSSSTAMTALQPCTPYCPGVCGFPDLECTHCQSLFHSKCVGIHQSVLERIRPTFRCQICTPVQPQGRGRPPSSSVTVIDHENRACLRHAFLLRFAIIDSSIKLFPRKKSVAIIFAAFHHSSLYHCVKFLEIKSLSSLIPEFGLKNTFHLVGVK